jgi:hypothetical protein
MAVFGCRQAGYPLTSPRAVAGPAEGSARRELELPSIHRDGG